MEKHDLKNRHKKIQEQYPSGPNFTCKYCGAEVFGLLQCICDAGKKPNIAFNSFHT